MITSFRACRHTFAIENNNSHKMVKTKQQLKALDYAMDYLEFLLKMEDVVGNSLNQRIEQCVRKYMEEEKNKK